MISSFSALSDGSPRRYEGSLLGRDEHGVVEPPVGMRSILPDGAVLTMRAESRLLGSTFAARCSGLLAAGRPGKRRTVETSGNQFASLTRSAHTEILSFFGALNMRHHSTDHAFLTPRVTRRRLLWTIRRMTAFGGGFALHERMSACRTTARILLTHGPAR